MASVSQRSVLDITRTVATAAVLFVSALGASGCGRRDASSGAAPRLTVAARLPEGEIPGRASVDVVFDRPVVAMGAADPSPDEGRKYLELEPMPEGYYHWIGTRTLTYVVNGGLPVATRFVAKVPSGIRAVDRTKLKGDVVWEFTTPRPALVKSIPAPGDSLMRPQDPILLVFNQPVDPAEVGEAVKLERGPDLDPARPDSALLADLGWDFRYIDRRNAVLLRPRSPLDLDREYTIRIKDSLRGLGGPLPIAKELRIPFRTYGPPGLAATGDVEGATLYFRTPVAGDSLRGLPRGGTFAGIAAREGGGNPGIPRRARARYRVSRHDRRRNARPLRAAPRRERRRATADRGPLALARDPSLQRLPRCRGGPAGGRAPGRAAVHRSQRGARASRGAQPGGGDPASFRQARPAGGAHVGDLQRTAEQRDREPGDSTRPTGPARSAGRGAGGRGGDRPDPGRRFPGDRERERHSLERSRRHAQGGGWGRSGLGHRARLRASDGRRRGHGDGRVRLRALDRPDGYPRHGRAAAGLPTRLAAPGSLPDGDAGGGHRAGEPRRELAARSLADGDRRLGRQPRDRSPRVHLRGPRPLPPRRDRAPERPRAAIRFRRATARARSTRCGRR